MKARQYTALIIILTFVFVAVLLSFYLRNVNLYVGQARNNGFVLIDLMFQTLGNGTVNDPDFQEMAMQYGEISHSRVIITTVDSRLLADSHKENISGVYYDSVLAEAKKGSSSFKILNSRLNDSLLMSIARPPHPVGDELVLIELISTVPGVKAISRIIFQTLFFVLLFMAAGTAVFIIYFRQRIKAQIKVLLKSTESAIESGTGIISIQSSSPEVDKLVEHFNVLLERYNNLIIADNKKYSRINTVFSSIGSGIIAVDSNNTISMVNGQAENLLNINKADLFSTRKKSEEINSLLAMILTQTGRVNARGEEGRFSLNTEDGKVLDVNVTLINNKYIPYDRFGVLAVIDDVTEMRHLENLRGEFISNVSHELRTPLTLISGFVETLKTWKMLSEKDRNRSLDIIDIETNRLKRLISELLLLSKIEGKIAKTYEEDIRVSHLVREAYDSLKPLADAKHIGFSLDIAECIPSFKGIPSWFRQIVENLCENAIKYTPEHGLVSLCVSIRGNNLILVVTDNGIGIPEKDREKIFERFYRVAKSRNRRIGGSGLGLAIARHIANEFGGDITLESREGEGSVFTLCLPIDEE